MPGPQPQCRPARRGGQYRWRRSRGQTPSVSVFPRKKEPTPFTPIYALMHPKVGRLLLAQGGHNRGWLIRLSKVALRQVVVISKIMPHSRVEPPAIRITYFG